MNPQVEAALIAGIVSLVSLGGTVVVAVIGFRTTRTVTNNTLAEQRTRALNERFAMAADHLGSDKPPATRLAGVYAMAGLADDWEENRQTCIDVLCAYLRMPYEPDLGEEVPEADRLAFRADREVRHSVIRVIAAHLRDGARVSWQGHDFDFTGVAFDGGDFSRARFSGGEVIFMDAKFSGSGMNFLDTKFETEGSPESGFSGVVSFVRAQFTGGMSSFARAEFAGFVLFGGAKFSGGHVFFGDMKFSKGEINFNGAEFSGANVQFDNTEFSGARVDFHGTEFSGGKVSFKRAKFSGGKVDFSNPSDWSFPPEFPWTAEPPAGVTLPKEANPDLRLRDPWF